MSTEVSQYLTLAEIKRANRDAGRFFFSPGAMRFFDTLLIDCVYGGAWFVYRNRFHASDESTTNFWKVSHALPDGEIHSLLTDFETEETATRLALELEAGRVDCTCTHCAYGARP